MAVQKKQMSREDYIKTLGFTPTDEQISTMPETFTIEVNVEDTTELTWEETQAKFKTQIDAEKTKAVKSRLGNKGSQGEIDVDAIKQQAVAEAIKATKLESFISSNKLDGPKGTQFKTLVEASIAAGQTVDQAITATQGLFVEAKGKVFQNDLGQNVVTEPGEVEDPILAAMEAAIDSRE